MTDIRQRVDGWTRWIRRILQMDWILDMEWMDMTDIRNGLDGSKALVMDVRDGPDKPLEILTPASIRNVCVRLAFCVLHLVFFFCFVPFFL